MNTADAAMTAISALRDRIEVSYSDNGRVAVHCGGVFARKLDNDRRPAGMTAKSQQIPQPGAVSVPQLNADGLDGDQGPLMDATSVIDDRTTITAER
ncbi:hypothetical protein [Mycobacterium marseillense]|jgi:hypothetical protein|uniref:Uncharacterized protein n=1 Tax=Mycobacterium marseillense TaxID=701042 RepID=A0ABN5ZWA3_9MYCO|nr:hypothetical protein [Mycobacterium marseillense]MCA2264468.1 hypothetical protein [Mycobacterium marseillense]MCV7403763.1 hypothetical protein [Mycobacterium marseillense]MDM3975958.1 hypothetical protein [Mycobacterium marseillense]BBY12095.1 hypothetical protein MMARJ_28350 [Mycobacterium marseillense]